MILSKNLHNGMSIGYFLQLIIDLSNKSHIQNEDSNVKNVIKSI